MMKQWILARRPVGLAVAADFEMVDAPRPVIRKGEVLLRTQYLGVAPVMLRYMTNESTFERDLEIGDVMHGRGVGLVVESKNPRYCVGDVVQAKLGWREYAVISDDPYYLALTMSHKDLPWSYGVGALGFNGFTAALGLRDIGKVAAGDRVLVSGAAGGVGSHVGFIAKALGAAKVVGIAGGPEKCRVLTQALGYDAALDYKSGDIEVGLDAEFPDGIDVFFDNVGGELLDQVMARIRRRARIVICGRISEYLKDLKDYHRHRNLYRIALMDARMEGFFIYDYQHQFQRYERMLAGWIESGALIPLEDLMQGLEMMPAALLSLYEGTNFGIRCVCVDPQAPEAHLGRNP